MKLRVGLVGLGSAWETRHRPALRALSDRFEVRAVCDQIALRAEQAAREWNAQPVDGFRALAKRDDVDAVLMLAPQWFGCLPILAACEAGKSIYCANALELDLSQAREVRARVEQAGVAFITEFPRRQAAATLRLKELIVTRLGAPRLLFCHLRVPAEQPHQAGRTVDGTAVSDMVELVDWCRYVIGHEPTSVQGLRHRSAGGVFEDDYQMMSLDFSEPGTAVGTGPIAQISCGRYMPVAWQEAVAYRPPAALQVACEHGIAFIDLPSTLVWFDKAGRHQESLDSERPVGEQLLSQFYRSVTSLVRNTSGLEDAYRALVVVLESRRSHAENRRMFLEF
ncbi:MAG TPA: Gfo/Idh/MocA family oxidoreductase [Pirellulales bacterium]|jgi:predicted dehydrogenase|nr:Gfo/Idh/MocA family oxidoreductase [Pirellulales bacterium]